MAVYRITPPQNPLGRAVAAVLGLLVLAGAFMLGLVAFAVVAALVFVIGLTAWLRSLFRRKRNIPGEKTPGAATRHADTIEAEYTVISRRREP